ncbi:hypothetical protein [Janibacter sp. LM]|uniref:hypothetical protein n=1 Tax=Janibacter sp. LM TaxID=3144845 RepID=UPI0031F69093
MPTTNPPSDPSRTESLDAVRTAAWDDLRFIAAWAGEGIPGHEEGRRILRAASRHAKECMSGCRSRLDRAVDVVDPTGKAFPVVIDLVWAARKANA